MHLSTLSVVAMAASMVLAVPAPLKRQSSSPILCPAVDKKGSALASTGTTTDEGDEFSVCTYPVAGTCTYFFVGGTFSSGSSNCPVGLSQTAAPGGPDTTFRHECSLVGAGGGATSSTAPVVTTAPPTQPTLTETPPAPPTTSTSQTPPTTSSAAPPPPPVTSTSTLLSTVQPPPTVSSAPAPAPPVTTAVTTPAAPSAPPASAPANPTTTTVNVNVTASASATNTPLGAAGTGNTGGAVVRRAGSALAVLPALLVLFSLL
ncbi:hypothetical protein K438DRAFT_1942761 [Mycena galopus ATCC 62051]|nr:hypothetical protein K438DRAFT_1942761 [Mycena galopus ATCC 62051]